MAKFIMNTSFLAELEKRQQRGLYAAGQFYLARMAETLSNRPPRHGRRYEFRKGSLREIPVKPRIHRTIRVHVASREGEAPALLTGELRKRRAMMIGRDARGILIRFGSNVPYAAALESEHDMNRPAWQPTMTKHFKTLLRLYCAEIKAGGKAGGA